MYRTEKLWRASRIAERTAQHDLARMVSAIGKRKRGIERDHVAHHKKPLVARSNGNEENQSAHVDQQSVNQAKVVQEHLNGHKQAEESSDVILQVVTGSYERVLHGFSAKIPSRTLQFKPKAENSPAAATNSAEDEDVSFLDTFLFAGHASSIRCLALSPATDAEKRILASGGSDERINLYSLSTAPPPASKTSELPSLSGTATFENSRNRSLGNLIHHDRPITHIHFPTKSKLFSAAEDNTIAISRTRDWTVLSSIKAPIPKPQGRPSGDTAGPGEIPAGVNHFAVHPSQKLMLTVSRGEKCMRLWNLMTGRKAGVLNFEREMLTRVGESKHSSGEGRRVLWDEGGESFVVGFERGAVVFGLDSEPVAVVRPSPPTKLHQMRTLSRRSELPAKDLLAISTEDGRVLFFNITGGSPDATDTAPDKTMPTSPCIAQLGGHAAGLTGRIKDFEIINLPSSAVNADEPMLVVTGSSDGAIRLWTLFPSELPGHPGMADAGKGALQVGTLIATRETGNRITCLTAFVLDGKARKENVEEHELESLREPENGLIGTSEESE